MMRNALMTTTLFASALLAACAPTPQREATEVTPVPPSTTAAYNHAAEVEAWRIDRLERLQKPEGWLSLIGLHWLTTGAGQCAGQCHRACRRPGTFRHGPIYERGSPVRSGRG